MRTTAMIFFLTVVTLVYGGLHLLVYKQFIGVWKWHGPLQWAVTTIFILLSLTFIFGEILSHNYDGNVFPLLFTGSLWLGIISMAFTIGCIRFVAMRFLSESWSVRTALGAVALLIICITISLINGLSDPKIKRFEIPVQGLPDDLVGFTVVHVSDIHIGNLTTEKHILAVIDQVNALKPDLIAVTGDVFDGYSNDMAKDDLFLSSLRARYGIAAVPGNHEHYAGIQPFIDVCKRNGVTLLIDTSTVLPNGITIVGFDDYDRRTTTDKPKPIAEVMTGVDSTKPVIVLRHRPAEFSDAVMLGATLQLSGHTHAGQIPPMDIMVMVGYKYPWGLYKKDNSFIYTSAGTGTWGPPMRLFSRNEISVFRFVKK